MAGIQGADCAGLAEEFDGESRIECFGCFSDQLMFLGVSESDVSSNAAVEES